MKTIKYVAAATFKTMIGLCVLMGLYHLISLADANEVYLPNLKKNATGTTNGSKHQLDVSATSVSAAQSGSAFSNGQNGELVLGVRKDSSGPFTGVADGDTSPFQLDSNGALKVSGSFTESATAADGSTGLPALLKIIGGFDGTDVQAIKTDAAGELQIDVLSSALPSGASTAANQATANASLSSIDAGIPTGLGQAAMAASMPVVIASDQSAVPASQSGTWNINNISGTVSLPTGAATAAKQPALGTAGSASSDVITVQGIASMTPLLVDGSAVTQPISAASLPLPTGASTAANQATGNASLSSIDGKLANDYGAASGALRTACQVGNASAVADFNSGNSSAQTLRVVVATNQAAVATKDALNAGGAFQEDATVTTSAETFTATANSVEVICQAPSSNTANVRVKIGGTASSTSGFVLEPGRDVTYHSSSNISYAAESGTQAFHCQFIAQ